MYSLFLFKSGGGTSKVLKSYVYDSLKFINEDSRTDREGDFSIIHL